MSEETKKGRKLKYESAEKMQVDIEAYFQGLDEHNAKANEEGFVRKHPTVTGLALAVDMTRKSLLEYEKRSDAFSYTITKAKGIVEDYLEQRLFSGQVAGCIFNLKNNFDWKDKNETEISGKEGQPLKVEYISVKPNPTDS